MKEIPLSNGKVALVDDEDYEELNKFRWCAQKGLNTLYARRMAKQRWISMHRQIIGAKPDNSVDHINHNGLDNQKHNLRLCTNSQNQRNRGPKRNNTCGYKGVSFYEKDTSFVAQIGYHGRVIRLGKFYDPIDAAFAYAVAAILLHGEFARHSLQKERGAYQRPPDPIVCSPR